MKFPFNEMLPKYEIDTPLRRAAFMAQVHHESAGFTRIEENLNYSARGLMNTWPSLFNAKNAAAYAHKPQLIASRAYANRMGNGPESSGDGWTFRGRTLIQITGKDNYSAFASYKGMSLPDAVLYMGTAEGALEAPCWFWKTRGLNAFADQGDIRAITRRINGGYNGLAEREQLYQRYLTHG